MTRYDLVVIGAGPAGHHAAIQGAKLDRSVAVVEAAPAVGGAGLTTGTVPSKALREVALACVRARGGAAAGEVWGDLVQEMMARCRQVVRTEVEVYRAQFARNRVDVLHGRASFADDHHIRLDGPDGHRILEAGVVVIATGTVPARSDAVPVDGDRVLDTDSILGLGRLPRSMLVVGGGVVGVEYACLFAAVGVAVTVVDQRPRLLEFADGEFAEALAYRMRDVGTALRLGEEVERVTRESRGVLATLRSRKELGADVLLYAVGRHGNTAGLNLAAIGLEPDARGRIPVDATFRTRVPNVYAVGDVVGSPGLASVAMEQGREAVRHAFDRPPPSVPRPAPLGVYTIPELALVGQTEEALTAAGVPYEVGLARYREIARGPIMGDTAGRLKLLCHRETRELLGVHIIGEGAAELVHVGQAVLAFGGTIDYFLEHVFNYPTLAECYKVAALAAANRLAHRDGLRCLAGA